MDEKQEEEEGEEEVRKSETGKRGEEMNKRGYLWRRRMTKRRKTGRGENLTFRRKRRRKEKRKGSSGRESEDFSENKNPVVTKNPVSRIVRTYTKIPFIPYRLYLTLVVPDSERAFHSHHIFTPKSDGSSE
ncbi:hypothetical protein M8J76_007503 [Diaphorina citri]|nr:hypothetical protein M8J76_007503 [Diaphorina citri]